MSMLKKLLLAITLFIGLNNFSHVYATDAVGVVGTISVGPGLSAPAGNASAGISNYLGLVLNVIFVGFLIALLAYILYGGIQWIMSSGDKKALDGARRTITNAIIGIILLSVMYAISLVFGIFIGVNTSTSNSAPSPSFSCTATATNTKQCAGTGVPTDRCGGNIYFIPQGYACSI